MTKQAARLGGFVPKIKAFQAPALAKKILIFIAVVVVCLWIL